MQTEHLLTFLARVSNTLIRNMKWKKSFWNMETAPRLPRDYHSNQLYWQISSVCELSFNRIFPIHTLDTEQKKTRTQQMFSVNSQPICKNKMKWDTGKVA